MLDLILDSCLDILKTMPILLAVYLIIELLDKKINTVPGFLNAARKLGPFFGALAGAVPQCGFSAAAAALYIQRFLSPATLIAVFLSTSDEAIPLMLSSSSAWRHVIPLVATKLVVAVAAGYLFKYLFFRAYEGDGRDVTIRMSSCSCCSSPSIVINAILRTLKTSIYLMITLLLINIAVAAIGETALSSLLLKGSILQPALCALIGLVPGCAISVFLTKLFINGSITFGAAVAGLSTGAGFGYVLLWQGGDKKAALKIIGLTYLAAAVAGTLLQLFLPQI